MSEFKSNILKLKNLLYKGNPNYTARVLSAKAKRIKANKEAENLVLMNKPNNEYTEEEKKILAQYSGQGALGVGDGDEYYTPIEVSKALFNLVNLSENDKVLEPSSGTGSIIGQAPDYVKFEGCDLNKISGRIADILNDNANIKAGVSFEEYSKNIPNSTYDSIITNVPFSNRDSKLLEKDEQYSHIKRADDYFILKSLDLLKNGKRAVFLTSSSTIQRASKKDFRLEVLKKGAFLGGIRLPSEMFKQAGTEQVVDILVFEKHPIEVEANFSNDTLDEILKYETSREFLDGTYFTKNKSQVFGDFKSREDIKEEAKNANIELHHTQIRDKVTLPNGMTLDDVKSQLMNVNQFENYIDYDSISKISTSDSLVSKKEYEKTIEAEKKIYEDIENAKKGDIGKLLNKDNFLSEISLIKKTSKEILNHKAKRLLSFEYDEKLGNVAMYILSVSPDEYDKDIIIENAENIEAIKGSFDKKLKNVKVTNSAKNEIRQIMSIIDNFDLENGVYKDTYEELEEAVSLDKMHPLARLTSNIKDDDLIKKNTVYENGIAMIKVDILDSENVAKDDDVIVMNGKVASIDEIISTEFPQGYYDAISHLDDIKLDDVSKNKMLKKIASLKQTLKVEDITVTANSINQFVSKSTLLNISHKLSLDSDMLQTISSSIKETILDEFPELDADEFMGLVSLSQIADYTRSIILGKNIRLGVSDVSKRLWKDDKKSISIEKERDEFAKSILRRILSENEILIDSSLASMIDENKSLKDEINANLDKRSTLIVERDTSYGSKQLAELAGMVNPDVLPKLRHYQNEDARKFGSRLIGTIAQDTGLGKTFTMLMSAIYSIRTNKAKRVAIITPNAVYGKFIDEAKKAYTQDFFENNFLTIDSDSITENVRKIKSNKNIKIVLIPHSTLDMIGLKDETIDKIYSSDKSNTDEQTDDKYEFAFSDLGVGYYPKGGENSKVFFEDTGIDAMFIDEAHFFKNSIELASGVKGMSGKSSDRAIRTLYKAEFIRMKRGDRSGVVAVTATPTTNSPQEIYANMLLSGSLSEPMSAKKFLNTFCDVKVEDYITLTDKYRSRKKLQGIKNIKILKTVGWQNVIFRDADTEKERARLDGKDIKVKPDYTINDIRFNRENEDSKEKQELLKSTFIHFSKTALELKRGITSYDSLSDLEIDFISKYGEVFGYFNRAKLGTVNSNFIFDVTPIKLIKKVSEDEVFNTIKTKYDYSFSEKETDTKKQDRIKKTKLVFTLKEWYESEIFNYRKSIGVSVDGVITKNGNEYYVNIPTLDYKKIKTTVSQLKKAKLIKDVDIFGIENFEKFKFLVENMQKEFARHKNSKQIVYATSLNTHNVLKDIFKQYFPKSKIHLFNGAEISSSDDDKALKIQNDFNDSKDNDILIFNEKGQVGVDFNKNVSGVHLLEVPDTPDQWHQAMSRAVRQGNDIDKVEVYRYIANGSFDELLLQNINDKGSWIDSIKGDDDSATIDSQTASDLFAKAMKYFEDDYTMEDSEKVEEYRKIMKEKAKKKELKIKTLSLKKLISNYNALKYEKQKYSKNLKSVFELCGLSKYKFSSNFLRDYSSQAIKLGVENELNSEKSLKFLYVKSLCGIIIKNFDLLERETKGFISDKIIETKDISMELVSDNLNDYLSNDDIEDIRSTIKGRYESIISGIFSVIDENKQVKKEDKEKYKSWFTKNLFYGEYELEEYIDFVLDSKIEEIKSSIERVYNIEKIIDDSKKTILSKSFPEFANNSKNYEEDIENYIDGKGMFILIDDKVTNVENEIFFGSCGYGYSRKDVIYINGEFFVFSREELTYSKEDAREYVKKNCKDFIKFNNMIKKDKLDEVIEDDMLFKYIYKKSLSLLEN